MLPTNKKLLRWISNNFRISVKKNKQADKIDGVRGDKMDKS